MSAFITHLDHVSKYFGTQAAVRDLSFSISSHEVCGFLGQNGSGKTTSLRMMLGILKPDEGRIEVFGQTPDTRLFPRLGFLPEERGLYRKMTARDAICFFARLKGVPGSEARRRADTLLEGLGLTEAARKTIKQLSKGMAQKVQLASILAHEPDFLILDEPFSGLDPLNQNFLEDLLREQIRQGRTLLFSTHVMEHAERLCDHLVMLHEGHKIFDGSMEEALGQVPQHIWLATETGTLPEGLDALISARQEEKEENFWRLTLKPDVSADDMLRLCVEKGVKLRHFRMDKAHLHDAFLHLIHQAKGQEKEMR